MALYDRDLQISSHLVLHRALTFGVCIKTIIGFCSVDFLCLICHAACRGPFNRQGQYAGEEDMPIAAGDSKTIVKANAECHTEKEARLPREQCASGCD